MARRRSAGAVPAPAARVLVTGGAGFIGSHLCDRLLAEGRSVAAVDDLSSGHVANLVEARGHGDRFVFDGLDVRTGAFKTVVERHRPEVVVHLAARPEVDPDVEVVARANAGIMGMLHVLEAAGAAGVRKVVLAVSAAMYGQARALPTREAALAGAKPATPAAVTEAAAREYLRYGARARGLEHTVLVLANVYGPRQYPRDDRGVVAAFAGRMLSGEQPVIDGDGLQTRDFLFVDDAVHALTLAIDGRSGRTLNVGTGVETGVLDLHRRLAGIIGWRGEPRFEPHRSDPVRRAALDPAMALREIGWKPWTHLEDGLRETVAFLRG